MSTQPAPFYQPVNDEVALFQMAYEQRLPLLLKGPTGCGKSRLVEHMAAKLGRPLITVACHDDTSAVDLVGRYLIRGGETVWQDGPLTRAVRTGAILYLDEIAEARSDVVVVIHPLTDHRRTLIVERHDEVLRASEEFMLVVSFNPGYQRSLKELKPSTRQRFIASHMDYPSSELERKIVEIETGVEPSTSKRLVALANKIREVDNLGLAEVPSTRLLVLTGNLIAAGMPPRRACEAGLVQALTDDASLAQALRDLVALAF